MLAIIRSLLYLFVLAFVALGCHSFNSSDRKIFANYLENDNISSLDKFGLVLLRQPITDKYAKLNCILSADARYLAIIAVNRENPKKSILKIINMNDGTGVAEIHAVPCNDHFLIPADAKWGPSISDFYVRMVFSDGGGEWLKYDISKSDFSPDAKKRLDYMSGLKSDNRPDVYLDSREYDVPVWDYNGNRYDMADQVKDVWNQPSFDGEARTWISINQKWFEVLLEEGIGNKESIAHADVFSQGVFIMKLELANNHTPEKAFLFYENGDLIMVGGDSDELNHHLPWKIRFPHAKLDKMFVAKFGSEQAVVLTTTSSEDNTVYYLRIRI